MAGDNVKDLTLEVLKELRAEMRGFRSEFDQFRVETRSEFGRVHGELAWVRSEFGRVHGEFGWVRQEFGRVREEMREEFARVREEMNIGFKAVLQQGDRRFNDHERRLRAVEEKTGLRRRRTH